MTEQQLADMAQWRNRARQLILGHNPPAWASAYLEHTNALEEDVDRLQAELTAAREIIAAQRTELASIGIRMRNDPGVSGD